MTADLIAQLAAIERRLAERVTVIRVIVEPGPDGKPRETGERIVSHSYPRDDKHHTYTRKFED